MNKFNNESISPAVPDHLLQERMKVNKQEEKRQKILRGLYTILIIGTLWTLLSFKYYYIFGAGFLLIIFCSA